ncbi:purine-cytosine permease family protein [Amycolatopsis jejuensis]|uniref:purine-cytosine permease family protein n=1 Tax=Amycolatopsis jejuensis TaxID=330084 RepID=UPI0005255BE3|nr:cytosine permease [Amycolatopsis jejuensis]
MKTESGPAIETRTVEHIPLGERHGKARQMFTIWFGTGLTLAAAATGFVSTSLYGLPWWVAVLALFAGCLVGGIVMALHAAQGPQTGVPQMLQTRAQFGSYGSLLVIVLVVFMYVGFFASNLVLGGQSIAALTSIGTTPAILFIGAVSTLAAIVGYTLIHRLAGLMSVVAGLALVLAFVWALGVNGVSGTTWTGGTVTVVGVMGALSLGSLWMIACAPFVSDYTRYLPKDTGVRSAFWATYWGAVLGAILPMALGALIGSALTATDTVTGLATLTRGVSGIVIVVLSVALVSQSAMYVYCGSLSIITIGQTLFEKWTPRASARTVAAVVVFAAAAVMAIAGQGDFLTFYTNFLLILLCVLTPWTAINLIDYYVIRHGEYDIAAMFQRDGGRYGRFNRPAIVSYVAGIGVQIPFLSTTLYTGPAAAALGGIDLSWIVGLVITSPLYLVLMRRYGRVAETSVAGSAVLAETAEAPRSGGRRR